jgi:hypothetical protein
MALKDFLVCVDQTEDSLVRLRLAVDLALGGVTYDLLARMSLPIFMSH